MIFFCVWYKALVMVSRYTKGSSTSLMIKEVKVKTTLRNHITPVRMPISERKTAENYESCRKQGPNLVSFPVAGIKYHTKTT